MAVVIVSPLAACKLEVAVMGPWYNFPTPHSTYQHQRLAALRSLISANIPCILWGEDALQFSHSVPTGLFDQQVLVPDDYLEMAAMAIMTSIPQYSRIAQLSPAHIGLTRPSKGVPIFPKFVRLVHADIPENEPFKLEPTPGHILLLPQSFFGLDVRSKERFQSLTLSPPFVEPNAGILVPKYHTFIEGLVEMLMNPPTGFDPYHIDSLLKHLIFLDYLLLYRIQPPEDDDEAEASLPPKGILHPIEEEILSELMTDKAKWYLTIKFKTRSFVPVSDIISYNLKAQGKGQSSAVVRSFLL